MRGLLCIPLLLVSLPLASAAVRSVGPGQPYAKPCEAIAAAQDGDVIEIDAAGNYNGDVCPILRNNLTIRGFNGRAKIDAAGNYVWGKGIWVVVGDGIVIENIEFSGARVPDRNGAGIRLDSGNLTVRNCVFHDNEMGILGGFYGRVLIEHSEFYDNGYGDGYSHNIYLNAGVAEFILRYSASRRAKVGHLVKSRAAVNHILYNRLTQESGSGSYEIDLPNGGQAYVIGNILQQGDTTQNRGMLSFGMEGLRAGTPNELYVVNNTFVSTRSAGATFVQVPGSLATPAVLRNNIFSGSGIITTQSSALMAGNVTSGEMGFLNPSQYDYRISNTSAALNAGVDPGSGGGISLRPAMQYHHPLCAVPRTDVGPIDAGAFEYGLPDNAPVCAPGVSPPPDAPDPRLAFFTVGSLVTAGSSVTATIQLTEPAPQGGAVVSLTSSAPQALPVPPSVTVSAGLKTATVSLTAGQVASATTVVLTASFGGSSLQSTVAVQPPAPQLASFAVSASSVSSGGSLAATVQLTAPAPQGGAVVSLTSSAPQALPVPPSVTVSAGLKTATVSLTAGQVTSATTVVLTASFGGSSLQSTVAVQPPAPQLASFAVSASSVSSGGSLAATVQLTAPAPQGGAVISLTSSAPQALPAPPSVTVSAGSKTAMISLTAGQVASATTVVLTASFGGSSLQSTVAVQPPAPQLASFAVSASSVSSGGSLAATVQLTAPAPQGGAVISLTSSAPQALPVPTSVTVSAGSKTAMISLTAGQVASATTVVLTASFGGSSLQSTITVQPPAPQLASFTAGSLVTAGDPVTATVQLTAPAPQGGAVVLLTSSAPQVVPMPPSVTVSAGLKTATISLTAGQVTTATTVVLTASLGSSSRQATITVQPAPTGQNLGELDKLLPSRNLVYPGESFLLAIHLRNPAPAGGVLVNLSSSEPSVMMPAAVVIPAGTQSIQVLGTVDRLAKRASVELFASSSNEIQASIAIGARRGQPVRRGFLTPQPGSGASRGYRSRRDP